MGLIKSEFIQSALQNIIDLLESDMDDEMIKTSHQAADIAMALSGNPDFDSEEQFKRAFNGEDHLIHQDVQLLKKLIADTTFSTDQLDDE